MLSFYIEFSILTNTKIILECVYENRFKIKYCIFLLILTVLTTYTKNSCKKKKINKNVCFSVDTFILSFYFLVIIILISLSMSLMYFYVL